MSFVLLPLAFFFSSGCEKLGSSVGRVDTVKIWSGNSHDQLIVSDIFKDYNKNEGRIDGIRVEYVIKPPDEYGEVLEIALSSGNAPDMFSGGNLKQFADEGYIKPYDDMPNAKNLLADRAENQTNSGGKYKGKTYTLPIGIMVGGLLYNKKMFCEAGITDKEGKAKPPATYEEMRDDAKKLTDISKKRYGVIFPIKWLGWFGSDVIAAGMRNKGYEEYDPATGKFEYDGYKGAMEAYAGMNKDGSVYPGGENIDNDTARTLFGEGDIGMKMGFSFDIGVLNDQFPAVCDWGVAPYPTCDASVVYKDRMEYNYSNYIYMRSDVEPAKLSALLKYTISDKFIGELYRQCVDIPYDFGAVEGVNIREIKTGWNEFCDIAKNSCNYHGHPETDYSNLRTPSQIFLNDIYTGKVSVDEGIKEMNEVADEAMEHYYLIHANESAEIFHDPSWKPVK